MAVLTVLFAFPHSVSIVFLLALPVNPTVFISTDVLYALQGDTVNISAAIHSTSQVSIQWYRNGTLLDPASDDQYSVTFDSSQSVLTIHSFKKELMGRYEIVVSNVEGQNSSNGVNVLFPGEGGIQEGTELKK